MRKLWIAYCICNSIVILSLFYWVVWYVKKQIQKYLIQDRETQKLKQEIRAVCASVVKLSERIATLEQRIQFISLKQDTREYTDAAASTYAHAAKIVEMGGNEHEIMETCGLTKAEAALMTKLYRKETIE